MRYRQLGQAFSSDTRRALALLLAACHPAGGADAPRPAAPPPSQEPEDRLRMRSVTVDDLPRLVWRPGAAATFAPTTTEERAAIARLVPALLAAAAAPEPPDPVRFQPEAARVGLRVESWDVDGARFWVLTEAPDRRRGAGAYLFRVGVAAEDRGPAILLEAPHADFDLGTGEIAGALFFRPPPGRRPVALFLNSMHRYQIAPGRKLKRPDSPADVAHNPDHLYNAATDAAAAALGEIVVVQLHGFADSADDGDDAPLPAGTLAVVSAGDPRGSSPLSAAVAVRLVQTFGAGVRRFPEEVRALGATTNAQKRTLEGRPGARFVHVESSAELRKLLRADPARLAAFGAAIFDAP